MANIILSISELNLLFQSLTLSILGYDNIAISAWNHYLALIAAHTWNPLSDPIPTNPYYFVRIEWPTEGAPAWKITEDIAFVRCVEVDNPYNRQRDYNLTERDADNVNEQRQYTRIMEASWVFYGPNSYDNSQIVKDALFYQINHDILTLSNLHLIPDFASARRVPELFEGNWWERVDISMRFNEFIQRESTIPYIENAEITIESDTGIAAIVDAEVLI